MSEHFIESISRKSNIVYGYIKRNDELDTLPRGKVKRVFENAKYAKEFEENINSKLTAKEIISVHDFMI